jgi:hypothetical protein
LEAVFFVRNERAQPDSAIRVEYEGVC